MVVFEDTAYAKSFTTTGHHDNGAGMAYKWPDTTADTMLRCIDWSCGATCVTPVAVFDPVQLEGTTVRRASLHNVSEAKRLGIGADGKTTLKVFKANLIIPQVASADAHGTEFEIPDFCPVCGGVTEIYVREAGAPEILRCTNPNCAAKQLKKFARFVSKDGLDIDGLSENRVADLISGNYVYTPAGLLRLCLC
ncbi:MAG: hypothetical protein LUG93_09165 [Lachnospiraceae bacterium]|nr:hypothetical protein [Lachnospiraceae bacterium]